MEQTDGRDETNQINNDSEEEAPSSNSSNGATQRASSPRKRPLRLYSSDQSDVVKSTTPTPQDQDEEQTNMPSCPLTRSKALSSGAVQNLSSSSSSASPDDSSGDNSEGGAREKTPPLVKTRPMRKGRFAKGTTLMASLKVKQNGGGTNGCKTKKGASSNRRSSKGKDETSPVSDNAAASDKNPTTGTTENEDHVFGGVLASIPDVGLCSFSDEVASVNSSKRKKRSLSPPLDSDLHKTNKASKMSDEDSDRVLSPEIDLQNQTTATSSTPPPAAVQAVKQDGVMASSQSCYTTAGQYNTLTTQELINNTPTINTAMPIGVPRIPHHSSRSLVGIHWSNEGGTRHPLMATGPSVLSVPEDVQNVSIIDTSAFPFHMFGRISGGGESLPLIHRSNRNTASSNQYTIHHRVNTDHVTGGHVTSGIGHVTNVSGHVTSGIGHLTNFSGHVTSGIGHVTNVSGHVTSGIGHLTNVSGHVTSGIGHVTNVNGHVTSGIGHLTNVSGHVTSGIGHVTSVAGRLSDMSLMQGYFLYPHHQFNEHSLSHGPVVTNAVSSPITSSIINEAISTSSLSNTSSTTNKGINSVHTGINFTTDSTQVRINPAHTGINSLHSSSASSKMNNNIIRLLSPDSLSIVSSPQGVTSSYSSSLSHLLTSSPLIISTAGGASTAKTTPTSTHSSSLVSNLLMSLPSHFQSIGLASTVSGPNPPHPPPPFSTPFLPSSLYSIVGMNLNTAPTVSAGSKKSSAAKKSSVPSLTPSKKNNKSSQTKTTSAAKKVSHSSTSGSKSSRTSSTSSSKVSKKSSSQGSSLPYLQVSPEWKDSLQSKMRDLLKSTNSKSSESRSGLATPSALTVTPITPSNSNNFPFPVPISPRPSSFAPAPSLLSPLSPSSLPLSPSSLPFSPPRTQPSKKTTKQSKGCTNKLTRPPPMRATTPSILGRTRGSPPFNTGTYQPPNPVPLTAAIASCLISPDQIDILGLNNFSSSILSLLTGSAGFACLDAINYAELERQFRSAQSILETQQLHVNSLKNRLVQARLQQQVLLLQSDHYQGCTKSLILPSMRDQLDVPISIPGYKTDLTGSISPDQWKGSFERPQLECLDFYK